VSQPQTRPARATPTKLVLTVHGTTVTAGGTKTGILSIYNQGPNNVVDAGIDFDLGALDTDRVGFELLPADGCRTPGRTGIACPSIDQRSTLDLFFRLTPAKGAEPGPAGVIMAVLTDSLHDGTDAAGTRADLPGRDRAEWSRPAGLGP
jgi:hypothetical protein